MKVFISHTFSDDDQKLASELQTILREENIEGYLAEKEKEYELLIRDKIRKEIENSDHMIAIVTNKVKESASVNQELGYALREGIRPVIMLEKNAKEGVLTHGIEVEEFTRDKFGESCYRIRDYISKKGIRKKLTDENKRELIDNVYRPCYNEMKNVYERREFITKIPPDPWKQKIENYWKLKTEPEMRELFENYSNERQTWEQMWTRFEKEFDERQHPLGKIVAKAFDKTGLLHGGDHIQLDQKTTIAPHNWLKAFTEVIFDNDIHSAKQLYEILLDHAKKTNSGHHIWLEDWWNDNNGLYSNILEVIPELVNKFNCSITSEQLDKQREKLKNSVEQLTKSLEVKLK